MTPLERLMARVNLEISLRNAAYQRIHELEAECDAQHKKLREIQAMLNEKKAA